MRCRVLIVAALLLPSALAAQSPAARDSSDGVMLAFERFADIFGSRLVAAFDSIPAARYDYRPTPSQPGSRSTAFLQRCASTSRPTTFRLMHSII